ncbi:MAG: sensor histidine kinase, partial [Sulfuricurvum sp.]|nr:sensor histidine kinase [Sulfuricurvum sp.]
MENWLQLRLSRLSLRELHFYTIFLILILFVIFSSLLIYEEYHNFLTVASHTMTNTQGNSIALKGGMIKIILNISTLALILFGLIIGISKIVNSMIARDIKRFLDFFESIHEKEISIYPADLYFDEFKKMAGYANGMATMIYEQKESLQSLNASLEERVKQKTEALQLKNKALEEEQKFSQG